MVGGMTDLTDQRELERQLRESQKLESVGRLAGGVAHDFNNLLTVIRGVVDLHLEGADAKGMPETLVTDLGEIREAAERATRLTRQLLAFSRRQILEPRVVDLNETVGEMQQILRRLIGEDVTMVFEPGPDALPVRADPTGIEQILVNLVVNSRDAMPTGGEIAIKIGTVAPEEVPGEGMGVDPSSSWICLEVRDTGTGMDEETLARCMEPFFTRKPAGKGTGLGLSTVYGIVRQTGGHISFSSEAGKGTTARVFLPLSLEAAESAPEEGPRPDAEGGAETVLLVEDEPAVQRLAARILSMAGYRVLAASGGDEALAIARETPPDLLLTDVVMPGMSGPELAKRLAEEHSGVRVLFTSGYTADAMERHGVPSEGAHFLPKPYTVDELTSRVREVLDRDEG
jgi:two-component system, cell cycle sensor histidine kinase and response regulator CckA